MQKFTGPPVKHDTRFDIKKVENVVLLFRNLAGYHRVSHHLFGPEFSMLNLVAIKYNIIDLPEYHTTIVVL
jgi:hypothetical protein